MKDYKSLQKYLIDNKHTWLVTGAAGFIGSNLVETLMNLNQRVIGLDNFITGTQSNIDDALACVKKNEKELNHIKDFSPQFELIVGTIEDLDVCRQAMKGADFVLHQAALGSVPRSIEMPEKTNSININGTLNMLIAANEEKVKRFVYASSSSVYGDHPSLPKLEEVTGSPLSPYAVTKTVNELYSDIYKNIYKLEVIGLRYFNIFGKRQDPNGAYAAVIPKWILGALSNSKIEIYGDGKTSRDFCYIENAIQANLQASLCDFNPKMHQVFNIALNTRTSLNELFGLIRDILKEKLNINVPDPEFLDFRVGDVTHSQASIDKAKKFFNYEPEVNFKVSLEDTIDWYIKNYV